MSLSETEEFEETRQEAKKRKREKKLTEGFERERKKRKIEPSTGFFIHLENVDKENDVQVILQEINLALEEHNESDGTDKKATLYEGQRIRIYPSEEEEKAARAQYREWYRNLPTVAKEREEKYSDKEYIKKRKEYSERPEVKQRKKERNENWKKIRNTLKKEKAPILSEFGVLERKPIKATM